MAYARRQGYAGAGWIPAPAAGEASAWTNAYVRRGLVLLALFVALAVFFRDAAASGFTHYYGDSYDGLIEISILQHWCNVFTLGRPWSETGYFYPYPLTLGYNDTDFVPALPFSLARLAGGDIFQATLVAHVAMKAIGFLGMYALLRRGVAIRTWLALGGAIVFTTANASLLHMYHAQLLSVGLVPWLALAAIRTVQALALQRRGSLYRWGIGCALLYGLLAFNAFYIAWFSAFFALVFLPFGIVLAGAARRATLLHGVRRNALALVLLLCVALAALAPLLLVYLPKLSAGALHSFDNGAANYLLTGDVLINVGTGNLVWGRSWAALGVHGPAMGEMRFGFPPGLLAMTVVAMIWAAMRRSVAALPLALGCAACAVIALAMRYPHGSSLWFYVYQVIPGADAVRVVTRFLLFALVPLVALIFCCLDRARWNGWLRLAIVAFLAVEQVQLAAPLGLDRARESAMLARVGAPPAACRAFFVVSARVDKAETIREAVQITKSWGSPKENDVSDLPVYRHNVDAMLIAAVYDRPTINGKSSFNPPDWAFADPDAADYLARVRRYVAAHRLSGVCGLDVRRTPHWFALAR